MLSGNFGIYPQDEFKNVWKNAIYADHGWGGVKGVITDRLFYENFTSAARTGRQILNRNLNDIASQIVTKSDCIPVVVFNPLSWSRTDVVVSEFYSPDKSFHEWQLEDELGGKIEWQMVPGNLNRDSIGFVFVAQQVPSFGYRVYYLKHIKSTAAWNEDGDQKQDFAPRDAACTSFENKFYSVEFAPGGIKKLFDKELQTNIADCDSFLFGELFTLKSVGFGCGEEDEIQPVSLEGFEKLSSYHPKWSCKEDGPVKTVCELTQKMKNCTAVQRITFYAQVKRIDCEVSLLGWDGTKYREFRLAFPVSGSNNKVLYEVPMGILEVGKDEIKNSGGYGACKDVHPREVQDWFATFNEKSALTISSAVSVFDWVNPVKQNMEEKVLQPVLLASRRSCHPLGSWYLQTGDHNYSFSIFSHKPDRVESMRSAKSAVFPMIAIVNPKRKIDAKLPEVLSFCKIDNTNAIISAFKKCEDDNSYIVRCYDFEGINSSANIKLFRPINALWKANLIEEVTQRPMTQNDIKIGPFAIETYKITVE
jgi:alpha-mannosidase